MRKPEVCRVSTVHGDRALGVSWIAVTSQVVSVVPALEEPPEVLAAAFLSIAFAQRLPQGMGVARDRQRTQRHDATDPVADGIAEVEVEDAVEAEVLVQRSDAREVRAAQDEQVALQGVDLTRLTRSDSVQLIEVAQV